MELIKSTIDNVKGKRILLVSFTASTPHLETSLEIANRLSNNNHVNYLHLGQYVSRPTLFPSNFFKRKLQLNVRVRRARKYLEQPLFKDKKIVWVEDKNLINNAKKNIISLEDKGLMSKIKTLEDLKRLECKSYNIGIGITSTLTSDLKDPDPFPLSHKQSKECYQLYLSALKSVLLAEYILSKSNHYDILVLLNGRFTCENAFKQVATKKGLEVYFHECGPPYPYDRFFFEKYMPHDWDERKKEIEAINLSVSKKIIKRVGKEFFERKTSGDGVYEKSYVEEQLEYMSTHLEDHIKECKLNNIRILSYYTTNDDEYQFITINSNRYPIWGSQINAIKAIADIAKSLGMFFIVRVHPNLKAKSKAEQERWKAVGIYVKSKGFYWVSQNDPEPTYLLLKKSDIIISAGSTVGIEAIYLEKPSIVITKCFYDGISSVRLCNTPEELINELSDYKCFEPPKSSDAYIYGAWVMGYAPKFQCFEHPRLGYGQMTDGRRIASPGILQKLLTRIKEYNFNIS